MGLFWARCSANGTWFRAFPQVGGCDRVPNALHGGSRSAKRTTRRSRCSANGTFSGYALVLLQLFRWRRYRIWMSRFWGGSTLDGSAGRRFRNYVRNDRSLGRFALGRPQRRWMGWFRGGWALDGSAGRANSTLRVCAGPNLDGLSG